MLTNTRQIGTAKEEIALQYLLKKGWRLLSKNYRCRLGEMDLIFEDGNQIIFLEVKFRSSLEYGLPQEAVNSYKKERLVRTALMFIKEKRLEGRDFRFDVVALSPGKLEHIANAFSSNYVI